MAKAGIIIADIALDGFVHARCRFGQPVGSNDNREHPPNHGFDRFFGFNAHAHDFWLHSQAITDAVRPAWPTEASAHLGKFADSQAPGGLPDPG